MPIPMAVQQSGSTGTDARLVGSITNERARHRALGVRLASALVLVALIAAGTHVWIERAIDRRTFDATPVNVAGRQRMLSQRIARLALQIESKARPAARPVASCQQRPAL